MVRQLSIDQFENESRRVSMGTDSISKALPSPMFERNSNEPCVSKVSLQSSFCRGFDVRTKNLCVNNACVAFTTAHYDGNIQKLRSLFSASSSTRGLGSHPRTVPSCSRRNRSTNCAIPRSPYSGRNRACCSCKVSIWSLGGGATKARFEVVR